MNTKSFNPLVFLASVGAGGIAIIPFSYLQYVQPHGKGLVTYNELAASTVMNINNPVFYLLLSIMIIFALIHYGLTANFLTKYFKWIKTENYTELRNDPLRNGALLVPIISLAMSMNVLIGVVRFFVPAVSGNFQDMMLPAMLVWSALWLWMMKMEISLLKTAFTKEFDVTKISFGWLLHPFAISMVTVTGTGIAAMAKNPSIASIAALMSVISGSMGVFLFIVKLISIFKSHFTMKGIPERQFLPSFLIVVPIITLFAISFFRLGHFLEHQFGYHLDWYFTVVVLFAFAFETWYLAFGIAMLKDYFKKDFFKKEYYLTLWAFVCPFVAYAVITSFVHKFFLANIAIEAIIYSSMLVAIGMFAFISKRAITLRTNP